MIEINNFWKTIWSKTLYKDVNLSISNQVYAVIWPNWSWKTTLFKCLVWLDKEYEWKISFDRKEPLIWYMEQELILLDNSETTILDYLKSKLWIIQLEEELNNLYEQLWNNTENYDELLKDVWEKQEKFEDLGWYMIDSKISEIITKLWFSEDDLNRNIWSLSWWQKRKILLALVFLKWVDLVLLDEPTNDLDIKSISLLREYIKSQVFTLLVVSHDIDFINSISNKIIEVNPLTISINQYNLSYEDYVKLKEQELEKNIELYEKEQDEKRRLNKLLQEEKNSTHKKARERKDNNKWAYNKAREVSQNETGKRINKIKQKMEELDTSKPVQKKPLKFDLTTEDLSRWSILLKDVTYTYNSESDFGVKIDNLEISSWSRLFVLWDNWSWKSTIIKLITRQLISKNGEIKNNSSFRFWVFNQSHNELLESNNSLEYITKFINNKEIQEWDIFNWLARFWIKWDDVKKDIKLLSPWERSRVILTLFNLNKYNTLILDEPTNHLDIEAVEELIRTLNEFQWTLIIISHDINFIKSINKANYYLVDNWRIKTINDISNYLNN